MAGSKIKISTQKVAKYLDIKENVIGGYISSYKASLKKSI